MIPSIDQIIIVDAQPEQLPAIVRLHIQAFPQFFLTFLGEGFLTHLYRGYMRHEKSTLLVAKDETNSMLGFVAFTEDLSGFYRHLLNRSIVPFAWYSLLAAFRNPRSIIRLLRALTSPNQSIRKEPYVELASIGVSPYNGGRGVGSRLVDAVKRRVDFKKSAYIKLETDAADNEQVNAFYQCNGFVVHHSFTTPEGRLMNEYRYAPGNQA